VKFKEVGAVLRRRHASTMTRALLQKSSSTSKISYSAKFSPFTEDQHGLLSAAVASPFRQQKAIGTRLATVILITEELGGFRFDVHQTVQLAKSRLLKQARTQGGQTHQVMQSLLERAARRGFIDPTTTNGRVVLCPQIEGRVRHDWWAHSLIKFASDSGGTLVLSELTQDPNPYITTTFPDLSDDALELLEIIDVAVVEELLEPLPHGGLVPVPWLETYLHLAADELYKLVTSWVLTHPDSDGHFPVFRDQIYKLPTGKYFLVAGFVPTGEISGQHLKSFTSKATEQTYLVPESLKSPPRSKQRGSD
jgi:hypothetical protein